MVREAETVALCVTMSSAGLSFGSWSTSKEEACIPSRAHCTISSTAGARFTLLAPVWSVAEMTSPDS